MKKALVFIGFVICLQAACQSPAPQFPKDSAQWMVNRQGVTDDQYHFGFQEEYYFQMKGDTTINSVLYKKLNYCFIPNGYGPPGHILNLLGPIYKGALRYDSLNALLYIVKANNASEELLYRFNAQVGDTICSNYADTIYQEGGAPVSCTMGPIFRVKDSTITFHTNNPYTPFSYNVRYLFYAYCGWPSGFRFLDGIGPFSGLFYDFCGREFCGATLDCFSDLGKGDQKCFDFSSITTGVASQALKENSIKVFPNPTSDTFVISSESPVKEVYLTDLAGKILLRASPGTTDFTLNLSPFVKGSYLLLSRTENESFRSFRIVKE